jgi:hypothetical protein
VTESNRTRIAVSSAAYPVCNAFLVLLTVTAIFATLGTHLFKNKSSMGEIFFADFSTSLFTMFQVPTDTLGPDP